MNNTNSHNTNSNNRSISDSFNGSGFQGNVNLGDQVTQTGTWGATESSKFDELIAAIKDHGQLSEDAKADAIEALNDLKDKKEKGTLRPSFMQRSWEMLPDAVKIIGAAAEVFKMFHGA